MVININDATGVFRSAAILELKRRVNSVESIFVLN